MTSIVVIDYSMGNLHSVHKALQHITDSKVTISSKPEDILKADKVVFPGQGAAKDCMHSLENHELIDVVKEVAKTKPFLGICMGMQVLLGSSVEGATDNTNTECMNIYEGIVDNFSNHIDREDSEGNRLKIPQMGWNQVTQKRSHPLWNDIEDNARFYFVHSYFVKPTDESLTVGETHYGINYPSAIAKDNVFAIQAHPEKSADDGLQLLKNFTQWDGTV